MYTSLATEYYGDRLRWFVADVIDASPPYGLEGRVRIRIHGVHSPSTKDIKQSDLPWAQCVLPVTESGVSGLGRTPKLESGALVFGMFMDGPASQVPIVLGSIPRIEFPSRVQRRIEFETVTDRVTQEDVFFENVVAGIDRDWPQIDDQNTGNISVLVREYRIIESVKFFLSNGYTLNQAVSIAANIDVTSRMITGEVLRDNGSIGLAGWTEQRLQNLKNFSNEWKRFSTQLAFILYELNTTQTSANIKLLQVDTIDIEKQENCQRVFARDYLRIRNGGETQTRVEAGLDLYSKLVG